MMVIFLTGLVSMILMRTLRNDYAKYARDDDDIETLVSFYIDDIHSVIPVVFYVFMQVLIFNYFYLLYPLLIYISLY